MKHKVLILIFCFSYMPNYLSQDSGIKYQLYNQVLKEYVKYGKVKYREMCNDGKLSGFVQMLGKINPDEIKSTKDKLAFWINTYNAFLLKAICDKFPVKSINDLSSGFSILNPIFGGSVWDRKFVIINRQNLSLNQIEHIIAISNFKDPRAHFALVCTGNSCPSLRDEAYDGDKLNEQLNEQARIFMNDSTKNSFNLKERKAEISPIFDWYESEFGLNKNGMLVFLSRYLPKNIREDIFNNAAQWTISYKKFDWALNITE